MNVMSRFATTFATLLGLFVLLSMAGCDTMSLEEEDVGGTTAALYSTPSGFETGVAGAYRRTRDFWGNVQGVQFTILGTDTWGNGQDGGWKYFNEYSAQLNPSIGGPWSSFFTGINTANNVLADTSAIRDSDMDQETVTTRIGELKFLRGLYYFTLLRIYGEVPLYTEPTDGIPEDAERTPLPEIYNQIIADLEDAKSQLPLASGQSEWGRATEGAAQHLLAEVYLERGHDHRTTDANFESSATDDFNQAATEAEEVIDSGEYQLTENYSDWFAIDNEQNSEVIWSVQYSGEERFDTGAGNQTHMLVKPHYETASDALERTLEYGRPWLRAMPIRKQFELYDEVGYENSNRYEQGFRTAWIANLEAENENGVTYAPGDTALWFPTPDQNIDRNSFSGKVDSLVLPDEYYPVDTRLYPEVLKHDDPNRPSVNEQVGTRDVHVFRLAHTYLVAAEAHIMAGNPGAAVPHVNAVRERVQRPGGDDISVSAGDLDLDFIVDEWGRETPAEFRRWFDLARTGTLVERVRNFNSASYTGGGTTGGENIEEYHALRPIPQSQIDALGAIGIDTEGWQNPGYN